MNELGTRLKQALTDQGSMLAGRAAGALVVVVVMILTYAAICFVVLIVSQPFEVGDTIEVSSNYLRGKVVDFDLIFTTLRDDHGHLIQAPNITFFQKLNRRQVGAQTASLDRQADRTGPTE